jgi:hypothetical protein
MQNKIRRSSSSTSSRRRFQEGAGLHSVNNGIIASTTDHTNNEKCSIGSKGPLSLSSNQSKSLDTLFLDLTLGAGGFEFCFHPRDCSFGANASTTIEATDAQEEIRFDFAQQPPRLQQLSSKQRGEWPCDPSDYALSENDEGYPERRSPSSSLSLLTSTTTAGYVSTTCLHNDLQKTGIVRSITKEREMPKPNARRQPATKSPINGEETMLRVVDVFNKSVSRGPVMPKPIASRPLATTSPMNDKETMLRVVDVVPMGHCRKDGSTCGATSTTHSASQPSHGQSSSRQNDRPRSGIPFDLTERPPPVGRCTPLDPCDMDEIEMVWGRVLLMEGNLPDHDLGSIMGSGYSIASLPKRRSRSFLSLRRKR